MRAAAVDVQAEEYVFARNRSSATMSESSFSPGTDRIYPKVTQAVLQVKMQIQINPRIRPTTPASQGKRQSGPSLGTPWGEGGQEQIKTRPSNTIRVDG